VKKLKSFDFERKGNATKYDWDTLLNGSPWLVPVNEMNIMDLDDSKATVSRFRRTAYAAAHNRNLRLQTQAVDDGLVIQVIGPR